MAKWELTEEIIDTFGWLAAFEQIVQQIKKGELDMPRFELTLDGPGKRYANYKPQTLVIYATSKDDAWHRANIVFEGTDLTVACIRELPWECPAIERKQA